MLELGWAPVRDAHDVWIKESVPIKDVASTLLAGLRECRGVTNPAQLTWSANLPSGERDRVARPLTKANGRAWPGKDPGK